MDNRLHDIRLQLMNIHAGQNGRYVFVRIPKTGSLSVNMGLWNVTAFAKQYRIRNNKNTWLQSPPANLWWDHYQAQFCRETLGDVAWKDSISFAVVRNPWSRLYAIWKYNKDVSGSIDFKNWIMSKCPYPVEPHHKFTEPTSQMNQIGWVTDENNNIMINFICRLEEIESVGVPVFKAIVDEEFKMPPVRKNKTSEPGEYKLHYDTEMIEFVGSICKKEIETFHYNFEGFETPGWFYWSD